MGIKKIIAILAIMAVIGALGFFIFLTIKQNHEIGNLKGSMTNLLKGETIDYFDVVGTDNRRVSISDLNDGKPKLIFIPKQPCISCSTNTSFWRRIANVVGNEVEIFGIWLGNPTDMFQYQENGHPGFTFYAPIDMDVFKQKLRLKFNYAQTILYVNNKVVFIKLDTLEGEDYTFILKTIKSIKNKT